MQNVPKTKTSRGWPVGKGSQLREILGISKGLTKRNGIGGGGAKRTEVRGSETVFCGGSPREVCPPCCMKEVWRTAKVK